MAESKQELKKPDFIKVEQLRPGTSGHKLRVKVVNTKILRQKARIESLVGDETGMIVFSGRIEQGDVLKEGCVVDIVNAKVDMLRGSMRLVLPLDKSGSVKAAAAAEAADITVNEDSNFSLIEFETVNVVEA